MQFNRAMNGRATGRRLRGLLVWGALTLLAAIALVLAMVVASLALAPDSEPAAPPTRPMQFPAGGPRPE